MSSVLMRQLLNEGEDDIDPPGCQRGLGAVVAVVAGTIPVTGHGLGVQTGQHSKVLGNTVHYISE